jgi:hypothetical protein
MALLHIELNVSYIFRYWASKFTFLNGRLCILVVFPLFPFALHGFEAWGGLAELRVRQCLDGPLPEELKLPTEVLPLCSDLNRRW